MTCPDNAIDFLSALLARAAGAGADAADALRVESSGQSATGAWASSTTSSAPRSCDLGLRVFVGRRQAVVSTATRPGELDR